MEVDTVYLIEKSFGKSFKFHSNLLSKSNKTKFFPSFYQKFFLYWKKHLIMMTEIPSRILSQHLWYNANIQIDKTSIHFSRFSEKNINYVSQLFNNNGLIKKWQEYKEEYNQNSYFQWVQLIDSIPEKWKFIIKKDDEIAANLTTHDHHLIKGSRVITLDKLTSTKIYSILTLKVKNKPDIYFENLFNYHDIDWTAVYMLPRLVMHNTYMRSFQYKILNNILYLNKKLHIFGTKLSPLCSFCNLYDETPCHILMNVTVLNFYGWN